MPRLRPSGLCLEAKTLVSAWPRGYDGEAKVKAKRLSRLSRQKRGYSFTSRKSRPRP